MTAGPDAPGSFFGRRKGKALRPGQDRLLRELLPRLLIDLPAGRPTSFAHKSEHGGLSVGLRQTSRPLDLPSLFGSSPEEVWLEIGFGGGEHLAHQARLHPAIGFIGIEPFVNGMAKLLGVMENEHLANLRLWDGDAASFLPALTDGSLARVYLLFPDPWPKRRQRKRRFLNERTLAEFARVLRPGGELRFATDIDDYAGWALARGACEPALRWTAERSTDWREPWPDWPGTRYERKARAEGRASAYLTFRRL